MLYRGDVVPKDVNSSIATIKTKKQYPFTEEVKALEKDWLELYFDIVKTEKNLKQQTIENARKQ